MRVLKDKEECEFSYATKNHHCEYIEIEISKQIVVRVYRNSIFGKWIGWIFGKWLDPFFIGMRNIMVINN